MAKLSYSIQRNPFWSRLKQLQTLARVNRGGISNQSAVRRDMAKQLCLFGTKFLEQQVDPAPSSALHPLLLKLQVSTFEGMLLYTRVKVDNFPSLINYKTLLKPSHPPWHMNFVGGTKL